MKKRLAIILGIAISLSSTACTNARTSTDAPATIDGDVEAPAEVGDTLDDASSELRQAQLNSDIRAREQRNDIISDQADRSDSDLESEVRAKLEANIPRAKLTIAAENGAVTVVGSVPDQREYDTIEPLAKEILGVNIVTVDVDVVPPNE